MKRIDVLLAALAAAEGRPFYPVHLQKTLFLIDRKLPKLFNARERYRFQPYDYGPFDRTVYSDADALGQQELIAITQQPGDWHRTYCLTPAGLERGRALLAEMEPENAQAIRSISNLVVAMSFRDLVSAIYRAFPDMKVNSVFKEPA